MKKKYSFANILFSGPCNLKCPFCIGKQVDQNLNVNNLDKFPPRNLDLFIKEINRYGITEIAFTGTNTDPQLYRHEAKLINLLRRKIPNVRLSLHTNGQLAIKKIKVFNLYDRVSFSLPSFGPVVYEKMTGSKNVPDLRAVLRLSKVPIKISCIVNENNVEQLEDFLLRCYELGIRRLALRRLYGDKRKWILPKSLKRAGEFRGNPVYDLLGMEVTYWDFENTDSQSLNLFSDGTISAEYLLCKAKHN